METPVGERFVRAIAAKDASALLACYNRTSTFVR